MLSAKAIDARLIRFESKQGSPYRPDRLHPYTLRSNSTDPLAGGQMITRLDNGESCTLGFVAQRDGVLGFVTASHCTSIYWGSDNTQYRQPLPSPVIGQESMDAPWYQCGLTVCRGSDAAFFASSLQVPMTVGKILRPTAIGSIYVDPADPYFTAIYYSDDVLLGQIVDKVGLMTGWTSGYVDGTCVDFTQIDVVPYHTVRCAGRSTYPADGGDSGAPVFVRIPGHPAIQGSELPGTTFWTDEFVSLVGVHSGHGLGMK